jgi:hypothetical protein
MRKISKKLFDEYKSAKKRFENAEDEIENIIYPSIEEKYKNDTCNYWISDIEFDDDYLTVYVEETWRYGGYDKVPYKFLISEIMDNVYLRKEKLKNIERITK